MITLAATPILETERLLLRAPEGGDWPAFDAFLASDRAAFVRSVDYSEAISWRAWGHVIGHWAMRGFGTFVITRRDDRRAIGMCGPWFPATWPEPEIGWTLWDAGAEGAGYAREAARATIAHAFGPLGWQTAVSYIAPANARSIALAERLGARLDPAAAHPGDEPTLVFRHPKTEARE
ncbi:GNAT family N-acetyltransferase [Phaeovulum sp.]|uniref:GNAT family N-acetyltransferase n=1 Tax=Phaeovulum sp. TaxID=2934796 RepID=UPI00273215D5|nr:GNAT family N-acetyltransferase [Phaeovulum sp.]MDP1670116.1 GNAT family N-acetyltransferase [Phaeovulum sp.]MDZ4118559.1 GNAT family N-acetyltransferase [Phaeovulum sp.]